MKRNFPLKPLFFGSIIVITALLFASCILDPVDTDFEDTIKVIFIDLTGDGLHAGNGRITGLKNNKYYYVEEYNDDSSPLVNTFFVASNGSLTGTFLNIGRVAGGAITGLDNEKFYIVYSAGSLPVLNMPITDAGSYNGNLSANTPTISLPAPDDDPYSLNISSITGYLRAGYQIIKSQVTPPLANTPVAGTNIILTTGTTADYLFFEYDGPNYFVYVFRIVIGAAPPTTENLIITVTVNFTSDSDPVVTPSSITYSQADTSVTINITVTGAASFTCYFDGILLGTGPPFTTLDPTFHSNMTVAGNHTLTVEATIGGKPFSVTIPVVVTAPP